ncbi:hypothetical protein ACFLSV_07335 [Bacteroidota bacterium]
MKKIISYLFLFSFFVCTLACTKVDKKSQSSNKPSMDDTVYIGMTRELGVYVQDHVTPKKFTDFFGWDTVSGTGYEKYIDYCREMVKKYDKTMKKTNEYTFREYEEGFDKLTNLRIGDKLYVSLTNGVFPGDVDKYVFDFEDEIGGGNIFYPVLNMPTAQVIPSNEIVIVSGYSNMSEINKDGIKERSTIDHFKEIMLPYLKNVVATDYMDDKEIKNKVESIDDNEIKVFKGNFTGKGKNEYVVSYLRRLSFDTFATVIFVMNYEGDILNKYFDIKESDFTFIRLDGIVDYNGDDIYELIIADGYYEGGGTGLYRLFGNDYKLVAYGFYFGV